VTPTAWSDSVDRYTIAGLWSERVGWPGNVAVKWASVAVNTYGGAELGALEPVLARCIADPAITPMSSKAPTTIGHIRSFGGE
jgi:hypothetical protein